MIVLKLYEQIYLLTLLNITSLEEDSTLGNYLCKIHKYFFMTNFRLVRNSSINIYQDILNSLIVIPHMTSRVKE